MKPAALGAKLRRNLLRPNLILRPRATAMIKEQAMNISYTKRILAICAYIGFSIYGLASTPARAATPNMAPDVDPSKRVTSALLHDPDFYYQHVNVHSEKGVIV